MSTAQTVKAGRVCDTDPLIAEVKAPAPTTATEQQNYTIKIDWLEFTLYEQSDHSQAISLMLDLEPETFTEEDYSLQGFQRLFTYGAVKVLSSPDHKKQPCKTILSGQALEQINRQPLQVLKDAIALKASFARIDLAIDCRSELLDMQTIGDSIRSGEAVHRFRRITPRQDFNQRMEKITDSWTFGSPKGRRSLTIYDKRLERIDRGKEDPGHWVRIEARWKKSAANIAAKTINDRGLDAGYFLGIIDFREKDNDQTDRRTRCAWWETFLGNVEPIRTGERKTPATIEKKCEWIRENICTTVAQVFVSEGMDFLKMVIRQGIKKTKEKEWKRLFPDRPDIYEIVMA